jgi:8-oxo-dGTP pyrophosphatase MutT (NUDIX family)
MIKAAGIFFVTKGGQALFLKRSAAGDYPGYWCFPGGKTEGDETPLETAQRETKEEAGSLPKGEAFAWTQQLSTAADPGECEILYTTFIQRVDEPFAVSTNEDEHTGWCWADISTPPEPLHPGCQIAIDRIHMDELGVARAIAAGQLTSPQRYSNMSLFALRITGTGTAYRKTLDEYVYRHPDNYLTEEFLARCNGLAVIWVHPKDAVLNSQEFEERVVGMVVLPYIQGDEVWGVAKIYDDDAVHLMETERMSTSPAVMFHNPTVNEKVTLESGSTLLIEGMPSLLDHLAICEVGVWDKGGPPAGVKSQSVGDSAMPDIDEKREREDAQKAADAAKAAADNGDDDKDKDKDKNDAGKRKDNGDDDDDEKKKEKEKADAMAKADAETGEKLDKLLSGIDSISSRVDAIGKRVDEHSARMDAYESGVDPKKVAADRKSRRDAEEEKEKEEEEKKKREDAAKADAARADAELASKIDAAVRAQLPKPLSDTERKSYIDTQSRWDKVANAFADSAPPPMVGESVLGYRKRLTGVYQKYCPDLAKVNLDGLNDDSMDNIEPLIHKAALNAAHNPTDAPGSVLREVKTRDDSGRLVSTFHGLPGTWMDQFKSSTRRVVGFTPRREMR